MVIPKATGFQFITSINTVAHDEETRRKVRSHARRQKLPSHENSTPSQSRKSTTQKERISKFRLKPTGSQDGSNGSSSSNDKKLPSAAKVHGPTSIIPLRASGEGRCIDDTPTMISPELALVVTKELPNFPMLRIETTPLSETLLKYCFTVCLCPRETMVEKWFDRAGAPTYMMTYYSGFLANAFAMNPEGNFFDALHIDTAITHAFMALVASTHNTLAQWSDTSTFDFHRLEAIKAINERLNIEGKSPNVPISDGIVMAVALLVNNETFIGSIQAAAAHMSGLKRIVDMRGGILEGFKYIAVVQRALVWADFAYGYAAGQPLMFPFVPQLASSLSLHDRFQGRLTETAMEPPGPRRLAIYNREIIEIFELIHSITDCLGSFNYDNLENLSTERIQLSDSIYIAEWRLFQLEDSYRNMNASGSDQQLALDIQSHVRRESRSSLSTDLSESLVLACHLFMHLALRGQPPAAPRHRGITQALMLSLCDVLLALDLLAEPEAHGSPKSHYSAGSLGNSSVESWSTTTTNTSIHSHAPTKPEDDFTENTLLWALFVAACVRVPAAPAAQYWPPPAVLLGDHHQLFIRALKNYCLRRCIMDKDTLMIKLKDVLWLNTWCENQLDLIWAEIGDHLVP